MKIWAFFLRVVTILAWPKMVEKVKATWDDPQGAPVKKSAETLRPPLKFGKLTSSLRSDAQASQISVDPASESPRRRFLQGHWELRFRNSQFGS